MKKLLIAILLIQFVCSCTPVSFLHRRYVRGIYTEYSHKHCDRLTSKTKRAFKIQEKIACKYPELYHVNNPENDLASAAKPILTMQQEAKVSKAERVDECGDTIFLRNKQKIACKIEKISEKWLSFKNCLHRSASTLTLPLGSIDHVKFKNGITENFPDTHVNKTEEPKRYDTRQEKLIGEDFAIFGYIATFFIGSLTALAAPVIGMFIIALSILFIIPIIVRLKFISKPILKSLVLLGDIIGGAILLTVVVALLGLVIFISML